MPESTEDRDFSFDDLAVAERYDNVLVPIMFDPWADKLLDRLTLRDGMTVLDLAAGSGIVTRKLLERLSADSRIVAADISPAMLEQARHNTGNANNLRVLVASADELELPDESVDLLVCQQGFQFFPDGDAAAREMHRVLKPGGKLAIATWCELKTCPVFFAMQSALAAAGHVEAAKKISGPFDFMPRDTLQQHFSAAGFQDVRIEQVEDDIVVPNGVEGFMELIFATPVAPLLQDMDADQREKLAIAVKDAIAPLGDTGATRGRMVANFLLASRRA